METPLGFGLGAKSARCLLASAPREEARRVLENGALRRDSDKGGWK